MKQTLALALMKSGRNIFLTGSAGAGKTYVLNQYISYLKERKMSVAITASTGIAATHINGMTIHSWAGIGVKDRLTGRDLENMRTKKYLKDNLEKVNVLILDEISMLHKNQLDMVNEVLQMFKKNDAAFGGIQVIFSGDFFQLPPIGKEQERNRDKFAFMANAWLQAKLEICYLTEQYRQTDNELNQVLNQIRTGNVSEFTIDQLQKAQYNTLTSDKPVTELHTHNINVDSINQKQLGLIPGKSKIYEAVLKGNQKLLETMKKSVLTEVNLQLKEGAQVMFVKNNYEKGYMNGTLGEVIGFSSNNLPKVKILNGKIIEAEREVWTIEDDNGKMLASFSQIPLRHSWAITVHKSQGMTLDAAKIDLSKTFEHGQGYVALSRLKDIKGLLLTGFNDIALQVDSLVVKADQRFRELCNESRDMEELEYEAKAFIRDSGGLTNPEDIEKHKRKRKEKKIKKEKGASTYQLTAECIEKGLSLEEIALHRAISKGTVITHLSKIKTLYPKIDLKAYRPEASIMERVEEAVKKVKKAGDTKGTSKISLNAMNKELNFQVSFDDIKLALVFID